MKNPAASVPKKAPTLFDASSFPTSFPIVVNSLEYVFIIKGNVVPINVAGIAIIIAALTNTIAKGAIAYFAGSHELRRMIIPAFIVVVLVGAIGTVAMLLVIN